jgi:hypothetical protein
MTTKNLFLVAMLALAVAACVSEKVDPLKSPCVGVDESPCGPKRSPLYNV